MRVTIVVLFLCLYTVVSGRTAVLILARGGSKGVPLKNLCRVGGVTLLGRAITTAKLANFEDVAVSTDHPIIALEALKHGARVFKRSYVTATDWAPSIWGVQEYVASNNGVNILVLLQATSPFTRSESLKRSLKKLNQVTPYDCVFSVMRSFKLRWNWNGSSYLPINFNLKKRPRRQDWRGEFIETGGFYITRAHLINEGYLQNNNCTLYEVSEFESLEIDSAYDIYLANTYLTYKEAII